jgi:signal transduction histidine kinase
VVDHGSANAGLLAPSQGVPALDLGPLYADCLAAYLAKADERALRSAYELGRRAIANKVGVLEIARIHHEALAILRPRSSGAKRFYQTTLRAGEFLAEALSSYEMANRGVHDAIAALRKLNETMEGEIHRIAHAVHDRAGQLLDAARLVMSGIAEASAGEREKLERVAAILDEADAELRRLSHELRPMALDDLGLAPALRFLADGFARRTGLSVALETEPERRPPPGIERAVYRIVQEALANVARHSHAKTVEIIVGRRSDGALQCAVVDDGIGFDVAEASSRMDKGLGLAAIRERLNAVGGTLQIRSAPGEGTALYMAIPLER